MLFVRFCLDGPDGPELRAMHRDSHRAYLRAESPVRLVMAGPLGDGRGGEIGSCHIVEADDETEARRFHEADPYTRAGVYRTVHIAPWDKRIG